MSGSGRHACPACGFKTLEGDWFGTYDICGVCGWEDDHVQLANPADLVADAYWLKPT